MATSPEDPLGDPVTVIKEVQLSEQLTDLGAGQSDGSVAQNVGHTFDDLGVPDWVELPHVSSSPAPGAGCLRHGLLSGHCLRAATPHSAFALCCELGGGDRSRRRWDVIVT